MNRIQLILSRVKSVNECTALYHIAERRAKSYEKQFKYMDAKQEWLSEQLRREVKSMIQNTDIGHMKAIEYCIKRQKEIEIKKSTIVCNHESSNRTRFENNAISRERAVR